MYHSYINIIKLNAPRILSQIDRDEDSPTFGCCDRNHWHYKIRDFSSAILQQSGLSLALLHNINFDGNPYFQNDYIKKIAIGTLDYWGKIQLRDGSFNEYYPNEHGFPPTAFSFFSACETIKELDLSTDQYHDKLRKTARFLCNRFESQAINQELGSIAALYSYYSIFEENWILEPLEKKLHRVLEVQSSEGWLPEYGGADLGYLSVSFDMLASYYMQSKDSRVLENLSLLVSFIKYFIHPDGTIGGEYGSRNTMYFLPFGLDVMANEGNQDAKQIRRKIYQKANTVDYFQNAIDDRYFTHYVIHSYLRSLKIVSQEPNSEPVSNNLPCEIKTDKYFPEAGLLNFNNGNYFAICSLNKGGTIKVFQEEEIYNDFGYRVDFGREGVAATNWLDHDYQIAYDSKNASVKGQFNIIKSQTASPIKHLGLRVLSFLFGKKIIGFLKRKLIFVNKHVDITFEREISFGEDKIQIVDTIHSPKEITIKSANSLSLRHVASGKFFKTSELIDRQKINLTGKGQIVIKKRIEFQDRGLKEFVDYGL